MKRILALAAVTVLVAGLALTGRSPAADKDRDKDEDKNRSDDSGFVAQAAAANLAEINLSMLAETKASSADVRKFAQQMVADHTKAGQQLSSLADRKRLSKPGEVQMDKKHREVYDRLTHLSGAEFDRAYMEQMVQDHKDAVQLFGSEADDARDDDLKSLAKTLLPTLKEHRQHAEEVYNGLKGSGDREGTRDKDTGRDKDREGTRDKDTGRDKDREGTRDKDTGRDKDTSADKDRESTRGRPTPRDTDQPKTRDRDTSKDKDTDTSKDRNR